MSVTKYLLLNVAMEPDETEKYLSKPSCVNPWVENNEEARRSVERGLEQVKQGKGEYLGSFAEYAELDTMLETPVDMSAYEGHDLDNLLSGDFQPSKTIDWGKPMSKEIW